MHVQVSVRRHKNTGGISASCRLWSSVTRRKFVRLYREKPEQELSVWGGRTRASCGRMRFSVLPARLRSSECRCAWAEPVRRSQASERKEEQMQEHPKREEPLSEELLESVMGATGGARSSGSTGHPGSYLDCKACKLAASNYAAGIRYR